MKNMAYYRQRHPKLGYTAVNRGHKPLISDPTPVLPKAAIPAGRCKEKTPGSKQMRFSTLHHGRIALDFSSPAKANKERLKMYSMNDQLTAAEREVFEDKDIEAAFQAWAEYVTEHDMTLNLRRRFLDRVKHLFGDK